MARFCNRFVRLGTNVSIALAAGPSTAGSTLGEEEALAIVRVQWFEGIDADRIAPLSPQAVDALRSLLADPAERVSHATAIELLGRAGGAGAYEAVAEYAAEEPAGEVDGAVYRARLAVPFALGHLARSDARAVQGLLAGVQRTPVRGWHYRQIDGSRMGRLLRTNAVSGLALSGRPEAAAVLDAIARGEGPGGDAALKAHAAEMRELHAEIRAAAAVGP
jgi:hypothetical protein